MKPEIIIGGVHSDNRGSIRHFNEFSLDQVRRFYVVEHPITEIVRAWQGHKREQKWFFVIEGSFKVILVEPNNWISPLADLPHQKFTLNCNNNEILHIPAGIATGFRALEAPSRMIIFSDVTLEVSLTDDFRFDKNLWYKW